MQDGLTFGVEEEFLLVDPGSFAVVPRASELIAATPPEIRPHLRHELLETQIEIATPICRNRDELREALVTLRGHIRLAAAGIGCRILPAGTGVMPAPESLPLVADPRYRRIADTVGRLVEVSGLSSCHVHVGVSDRGHALDVLNRIRGWLPVLQALAANSAVADGADTGYASWRSILVDRWPVAGPYPRFSTPEQFDRTVTRLQDLGLILDRGMLYWHARPSAKYPTVEIRVADVCPTVDETLLQAVLSRAVVRRALDERHDGRSLPETDDLLLRAAHWRAAKDGLEGSAVDLTSGDLVPAWAAVGKMVATLSDGANHNGDLAWSQRVLSRLRQVGSGATRQRRALARGGRAEDVARDAVEQFERGDLR